MSRRSRNKKGEDQVSGLPPGRALKKPYLGLAFTLEPSLIMFSVTPRSG
jgi:hypothetical protein